MMLSACAIVLAVCSCAQAVATPSVEADVDQYTLSEDDVLQLSVTVNLGARDDAGEPTLDEGADFEVSGYPQRESGYSIINMQMRKYVRRVYQLSPRRTGDLTVPAVSVPVNGKTMRTNPIKVRVTAGQGASPGNDQPTGPVPTPPATVNGDGLFSGTPRFAIICRVLEDKVFVNQQLTLEVDYYTAYRLPRTPGQEAPQAEGFVAEDLPDPDPEYVVVNGEQYARLTNRWALFATSPGAHEISSAPEELMLPPAYSRQVFNSNKVTVNVKPLPKAPPGSSFGGAVGEFVVQLAADKTQVKAGEGLTVRATVDGTGNLQSVEPPKLDVPSWCKVYDSGEKRSSGPREGGVLMGGRAEFEYLIVPRQEGKLTIPQARLTFFNPASNSYETATSPSLQLTVTRGEVLEDEGLDVEGAAIRHIHTGRPRLTAPHPLLGRPGPYVLMGLCLVALSVAGIARFRESQRLADPEGARASGAARAARRAIKRAQDGPGAQFYEELMDAVGQYLSDKFGIAVSGLSARELHGELIALGVSDPTAAEAESVVNLCQAHRFAPGLAAQTSPDDVAARALDLIASIEQDGGRR